MSSAPEGLDRNASVTSPDFAALGAQLSEVLGRFHEMSAEMAAQRRVIDQLVANSSGGGTSNDHEHFVSILPLTSNPPLSSTNIQTTLVPPIPNLHEIAFSHHNTSFPYTHPNYILLSPTKKANPHTQPQITLNIPPSHTKPHLHTTEPFVWDIASQGKPEMDEPVMPVDKDLMKRLDRFEEFIKKNQGLNRHGGLDYNDLCLFPDIQLPMGFKTPKFSKYDGTGNPKTHLKMFANKLGKPVDDENLPMRLFPESLEGDALDWYSNLKSQEIKTWLDLSTAFVKQYEFNCELAPTRTTLEGIKRRPSEDHKSYAKRWRKLAAKVEPPMTEEEIVRTFIKAHDPPYFEEIFRMTGSSFATIVNKLEEYDEFVKVGKIVNVTALKQQLETLQGQNGSGRKLPFKKNEGEAAFVWDHNPPLRPRARSHPTNSSSYLPYPYHQPVYHTAAQRPHSRPIHLDPQPLFSTSQPISHPRQNYAPRPAPQNPAQNSFPPNEMQNQKTFRTFTDLGRPIDQLYEQLKAAGKIGIVPPKLYPRGPPTGYDPHAICAYHSGSPGHSTINCWALKHRIQDMVDAGDIVLKRKNEQRPNVNRNPFPEHKNVVGMISVEEEIVDHAQFIKEEDEDGGRSFKERSGNDIETRLSQLFVGITLDTDPTENVEFPSIP